MLVIPCTRLAAAPVVFTDDEGRDVPLPDKIERVFAAGAPAEVLLYTLAPDKLVGRNHVPTSAAQRFMPEQYRQPVPIQRLPNVDDALADGELLALRPDVYVDYGDVNEDYIRAVQQVQSRTGVPGIILDGALARIPDTYARLGAALGVAQRGAELQRYTEELLQRYQQVLSQVTTHGKQAPRVYLTCGTEVFIPCFADERNGEVLQWLGAENVAGTLANAPRRPLTLAELAQFNPDVMIVSSEAIAKQLLADPAWQKISAIKQRRVLVPPAVPFSWGTRPPSVNRLLGMIWMAYAIPNKPFDAGAINELRDCMTTLYHYTPSDQQLRALLQLAQP